MISTKKLIYKFLEAFKSKNDATTESITSLQTRMSTVEGRGYITESGSNNGWEYTKFSSGMFIASKYIANLSVAINQAGAGGYFSDSVALGSLGFTIDSTKTAISVAVGQLGVGVNPTLYDDGRLSCRLWRGASVTLDANLVCVAIGKWT